MPDDPFKRREEDDGLNKLQEESVVAEQDYLNYREEADLDETIAAERENVLSLVDELPDEEEVEQEITQEPEDQERSDRLDLLDDDVEIEDEADQEVQLSLERARSLLKESGVDDEEMAAALENFVQEASVEGDVKPGDLDSEASTIGAITQDLRQGLKELPRAAVRGIVGTINETVDFFTDDLPIIIDELLIPLQNPSAIREIFISQFGEEEGEKKFKKFISRQEESGTSLERDNPLFQIPQPFDPVESVSGNIAEALIGFFVPFSATLKALRGPRILKEVGKTIKVLRSGKVIAKAGKASKLTGKAKAIDRLKDAAKLVAAGTIADKAAFDEHEARLSNLIERFPKLRNPVTNFLAARSPEELSTSEAVLRQILEGAVIGVITDGFIGTLKALRAFKQSDEAVEAVAKTGRGVSQLDELEEELGRVLNDLADEQELMRKGSGEFDRTKLNELQDEANAIADSIFALEDEFPEIVEKGVGDKARSALRTAGVERPEDLIDEVTAQERIGLEVAEDSFDLLGDVDDSSLVLKPREQEKLAQATAETSRLKNFDDFIEFRQKHEDTIREVSDLFRRKVGKTRDFSKISQGGEISNQKAVQLLKDNPEVTEFMQELVRPLAEDGKVTLFRGVAKGSAPVNKTLAGFSLDSSIADAFATETGTVVAVKVPIEDIGFVSTPALDDIAPGMIKANENEVLLLTTENIQIIDRISEKDVIKSFNLDDPAVKAEQESASRAFGREVSAEEARDILVRTRSRQLREELTNADAINQVANRSLDDVFDSIKRRSALTPEEIESAAKRPRDPSAQLKINFARIDGSDDIKQAMEALANDPNFRPSIEAARRGTLSNKRTLKAARDIDGLDLLMKRRAGEALNAEEAAAVREVYYQATEKLMEAARRAADPNASSIDQFNFRKMVAVHHAIQKEVLGARAEAGRALQAWAIPTGEGSARVQAIEELVNSFGGVSASQKLARKMAQVGDRLTTSQINNITQKGALARTADAMTELWTLGLLTNVTTHAVNFISNQAVAVQLVFERFAQALMPSSDVTLREAFTLGFGMIESFKDALRNSALAFKTGKSGFGVGKIELPRVRATSKEVLDIGGPFGVAIDFYGRTMSKVGDALVAGDEFSKTILFNAQKKALAMREGINRGLKGDQLNRFIMETVAAPSEAINASAMDFAQYGTFTRQLEEAGQGLQSIIARIPALRFVVPFLRTPANIFKFTFERTPLGVLSRDFRAAIRAGGNKAAAAMSKVMLGSLYMAIAAEMAFQGKITGAGPSDHRARAALRRKGWQPYSIKVGDKWVSYQRLEPIGTILGLAADLAELVSNYDAYDMKRQKEVDKLIAAAVMSIGNQVIGKTFLRGFAAITEFFSDPEGRGSRFVERFSGSFVPAGVAAAERSMSPAMSEVYGMMDQIKSRVPGMSDKVPPARNIWGEKIETFTPGDISGNETADRLISLISPFYISKEKDSPIDQELLRLGNFIDMPTKVQNFSAGLGKGVEVDLREFPKIYDRLIVLRGQEIELPQYNNMNLQDYLNALVDPDSGVLFNGIYHSNLLSDEDKIEHLRGVVSDYQKAAKMQLMEEFPGLRQAILEKQQEQVQEIIGGQ